MVLPDRKELAGPLLSNIFESVKQGIRYAMKDSDDISFSIDGSKNAHNIGVLCIIVCTPKRYAYRVFETGVQSVMAILSTK